MMTFPQIDPVIFQIGPLAVRWYGLMYLLGFVAAYMLIRHLVRLRNLALDKDGVSDLLFTVSSVSSWEVVLAMSSSTTLCNTCHVPWISLPSGKGG